jgi:hypothetical protein
LLVGNGLDIGHGFYSCVKAVCSSLIAAKKPTRSAIARRSRSQSRRELVVDMSPAGDG